MKKRTIKIIMGISMIMLLSLSCEKSEENVPPTIKLIAEQGYVHSDTMLAPGDDIRLKVQMQKGDLNITNFLIDVHTDTVSRYFDTGMNTAYIVWEGLFIKTPASLEEWKFLVYDREGNATATGISITLDTSTQYAPLTKFSPIDFGAQDNPQLGGCFDIADSSMYFHYDVAADPELQNKIEILCFYDDTDKATISSSGANIEDGIFPVNPAEWTNKNTTRYFKTALSADDFNSAVNDSIILANYDEGEAKRKAKNLAEDDIYTFRTESGKMGLFKVNAVTNGADGSINISMKTRY